MNMKTIKKYLFILLLYTSQSYGQYIGSYNSIGSNFIGLSPYLRTMSADKIGDVYYKIAFYHRREKHSYRA